MSGTAVVTPEAAASNDRDSTRHPSAAVPAAPYGRRPHHHIGLVSDGLVERRGENLDIGFERLKRAALETDGTVEELLTSILDQAIPGGSADDPAILGMRWDS